MNEIALVESYSLRQEFCNDRNATVLDKIGTLIFLEGMEFTTLKNVAAFYMVPQQAIKSLVFDHKDELKTDGYKVMSKSELEKFLKGTLDIPTPIEDWLFFQEKRFCELDAFYVIQK